MKRLIATLFMCIMAWGNPADYIQVIVNGVEQGDYTTPMAYSVDYLPAGSHHITIIPHLYVDHTPVQVDMTAIKKENKKFIFWELIPQPGDEYAFGGVLKIKEKK